MKITDKYVSFVLFFIPFMFTHCFADWGPHGQAQRYPFNKNVDSNSLSLDTTGKCIDGIGASKDSIPGLAADPLVRNKTVVNEELASPESASIYCNNTLERDTGSTRPTVYNFSITDFNGLMLDGAEPSANIKRFRGTVEPGGDTIHFRIPVYGDISLENIEFSGVVYKDPEIFVETSELGNPYSFSSGLWTAILSLGGIFSSVAFTEPALSEKTYSAEMITLMVCGYIASGVGQYFGVYKMARHFRWKHQFRNRSSH